jgi:hypothetical protein
MREMKYFVLVYDQLSGNLELLEPFPEAAPEAALERRFELERQNRERPELEVVLLSADSEEALRQTHSRYFETVEQLASGR